ncbi:hypothetical protein HPULCUR_004247 [Helicostylum pulchrum]|uniref:Uncharacterized protein n=1 Tax=Helicostylum pulchrum TaxID=562976 RepID=A0ABP9XVP2_9FUNG
MKFISLLAIAACAVLVSAAPHGGSNQEVDINDESNFEVTDNSHKKAQIIEQNKVEGNTANDNSGLLGGVLGGNILGGDILQGGVNVLSGTTANKNENQVASNKDN